MVKNFKKFLKKYINILIYINFLTKFLNIN